MKDRDGTLGIIKEEREEPQKQRGHGVKRDAGIGIYTPRFLYSGQSVLMQQNSLLSRPPGEYSHLQELIDNLPYMMMTIPRVMGSWVHVTMILTEN